VYGPIEYQGLGIPDLYTSQGISHIERILKYSHLDDDITGQLTGASVEQLKLEIGCNGPTLSLPYEDFTKLATNCWIRQTWQFMDAHQIRIEFTSPDFLLSRANDQLLIPLFHEQGILRRSTPTTQSIPVGKSLNSSTRAVASYGRAVSLVLWPLNQALARESRVRNHLLCARPRPPQSKRLDEIPPFSRFSDSWHSCFRRTGYCRMYSPFVAYGKQSK
jgi:hypothetical protein